MEELLNANGKFYKQQKFNVHQGAESIDIKEKDTGN